MDVDVAFRFDVVVGVAAGEDNQHVIVIMRQFVEPDGFPIVASCVIGVAPAVVHDAGARVVGGLDLVVFNIAKAVILAADADKV